MSSKNVVLSARLAQFFTLLFTVLAIFLFLRASTIAQTSKENKQTCEEVKRQLKDLQDALAQEEEFIEKAQQTVAKIESQLAKLEANLRDYPGLIAFGKLVGSVDSEEIRGKILDARAAQLRIKHAINDAKEMVNALEKEIADLLNKLGNCSGKQSAPTPSPSPTPTPTPTPNPPQNRNVGLLPGYHVDSNITNGLSVTTITTPQGKIKVNLPDDMAAGDTISGTVETEPNGKNDTERAQNQTELNGYVIQLGGQKTNVGDKKISCIIPITLMTEAKTIVLQYNGQTIVIPEIPISPTQPPTPTQPTLPTGGQQGRTLECGGNFAPTDTIKIGGTVLPEVAASPRKKIVRNTSDVVGPTTIECTQHGAVSQCPFRNIGIKLSADKLNLMRGETTTLHVVVMGLAGINQEIPLDLVNNSPSVISISGGNVQHINIQPPRVQSNGTAAFDFTLNGIMAGGFGITGTVRWKDVCRPPSGN